jgi:hypothetical protein
MNSAATGFKQAFVSLLRHRLTHFLLGGGLLFLFARLSGPDTHIHLSSERLNLEARTRPDLDLQLARQMAIQDEVLYREALRLGLDRDDPVVRRRLIEKLLLLTEDLSGASQEPSDAELRQHLALHAERFQRPPRFKLEHVVASTPEALEAIRPALLAWSQSPGHEGEQPPFGEPWPAFRLFEADKDELSRDFGNTFADAAQQAEAGGGWSGPVHSRAGWHLLRVLARDPASTPPLEEIRSQVMLDLLEERRRSAVGKLMESSFARYHLDIDGTPLDSPALAPRTAARSEPSGED